MEENNSASSEKIHVLSPATAAAGNHFHHAVMTHNGGVEYDKTRRRSTIHSYTLSNYHALSHDPATMRAVHEMTWSKAYRNVVVLGLAFMFVFTAFVSIQGLQSTMNWEGGVGVTSLSSIYLTTIISCLVAPWVIQKLTAKWTIIVAFVMCTGYFAGNFHPEHYMLIPLGAILGLLGGPLWSAQATSITSISLAYAEHIHSQDQDIIINKMMGIFCGLFRTSNIWGNLITTLVLNKNDSIYTVNKSQSVISNVSCGSQYCLTAEFEANAENPFTGNILPIISSKTKIMLLSVYLGCGMMGIVILISLFDQHKHSRLKCRDDVLSSKETFLSTIKMFKDTKCLLLLVIVMFVGLEQGFMFSDFTKAYISCTLGMASIGPVMMCFGAVSSISCVLIGCIASRHIKRFAFISAGATFNVGLLIVLWLWKPSPLDIPNFYVVAGCLGLCDAIWQTQTYTLFGIIFMHKQEAAFASYRMFYATGCAVAFGYSYFLCVETKVVILAVVLVIGLICYCVIEMKVQLQSQHIKDIVAL